MKLYAELLAALFATLLFSAHVCAQTHQRAPLECVIRQISLPNRSLHIACSIAGSPGRLIVQFTDKFAGVDRLSERIHSIKVTSAQGAALPMEIRGDGLYFFTLNSTGPVYLSYEMQLARALDPSQYALVSSLGPDAGVFMIGDLLPRICFGDENCSVGHNVMRLKIEPPADWRIATTEAQQDDTFRLVDPSRAIFFLGRLRDGKVKIGAINLRVAIVGDWSFREQEVFFLAEAIAREQAALVGGNERGEFLVTLAPFPQPLTGLRSSAVTIGRTVVLLLNPNNDASQSFKHYRRHLAHEMFHFYLPNAFRVRENFDWFWEGFTRYVALMTLARLRLIDLQEYLNAINAEYEAYIFNPSRTQLSLIAASPEKFANAASYDLVYRKGMLVAALYDLELRWQSRGNFSLADVMKTLYRNYSLTSREIGSQEVLQEMKSRGDFALLIHDDIVGLRQINLAERVKIYGLVIEQGIASPGRLQLKPAAKLSSRQQALISKLTQ
ncbi:MAG: hypothetical protein ABI977_37550 [Acidobacteriota bacterium]